VMSICLRMSVATLLAGIALVQATAWSDVAAQQAQATRETITVPGLEQSVEILKDRWGISHIYAETEHDLFFAQGYSAVRDRLFQFELWRRQATGTVSEILGPREIQRDIGTRLFKFRGDLDQELSHYHPNGVEIINAFVQGINAYVDAVLANPDLLTVEFELLGIVPGKWTPEVVISRHQGLLGNITAELNYGRAVAAVGGDVVKSLRIFEPGDPLLDLDPAIDGDLLSEDILGLYNAFRASVRFQPEDIAAEHRLASGDAPDRLVDQLDAAARLVSRPETRGYAGSADPAFSAEQLLDFPYDGDLDIGSNNWVVAGSRSASGYPIMANDPHRAQAAPSLRYWAHLVGPGWNVIGGGEPVLPGLSIGHNEFGAWGLTVFRTDGEDLYVYETNPSDPNEYRYQGHWEAMNVIRETITVRGEANESVELKYTRHGPVVFEDPTQNVAYAVRAAWQEVGGAPYLASLRMDQSETWEEFREASNYSNIPGENMVWADRAGNIGWQAVGIAPVRRNWSGLVPVPGDGRYEWDGYLPIKAKPHVYNPPEGYFATANNNLTPPDYPYMDAIGFDWTDPYRWLRAVEVLGSGRRFNMTDMMSLQTDALSIPARTIVPMLDALSATDRRTEEARRRLLDWDYVLDASSVEAGIYVAWERRINTNLYDLMVPEAARPFTLSVGLRKQIEWLTYPPGEFGVNPIAVRDAILVRSLEEAIEDLRSSFGSDMSDWQYGQTGYHHVLLAHPLSGAVDEPTRERLEVGPFPRGGNGYTLLATGGGDNQTSGASFRIIVDTSDWDRTVGMNTPGQGGDPDGPHYEDLFELWATDRFHPVFYSRDKVEGVTEARLMLEPRR
jgi:penicillin amidase